MTLPTLTALATGHGFTAGDLDTSGYVAVVPAYQRVYFADGRAYSATLASSGYHKLDFINTRIVSDVNNPGWTRGETVTQDQGAGVIAYGVFDETVNRGSGVYWHLFYRTTPDEFTTGHDITGGGHTLANANISAVVAPPHWLNWVLEDGIFPDGGSNIMALCFGRIFMNSMFNPHQWFATRTGDPLDLLVSQSDVGSAVSSQTSKAGLVGDEITAMVSYKDNYLIFGCLNEVWVLRSDPMAGGVLTNVSKTTGIFSQTAWCWDDKSNFYFMGNDGIYGISADAIVNAQPPTNLTKEHLPQLVTELGLNRRTDRVTMAYDKARYGIVVSVAQMDGVWSTTFWLDLRTGGLFPETYQDDHVPASMLYFDSRRSDQRGLLLGGQDGYIRKFSESDLSDDGSNAIDSYAVIGPLADIGNIRSKVSLTELSVITGLDTTNLDVGLYVARTAQELMKNLEDGDSPLVSRNFTSDKLLPSLRQKVNAGAVAIKLSNSTAEKTWSIERINTDLKISRGKE